MRHTRRAIRAAHATGHALVAAACGLVGLLRYAAETGRTVRIGYVKDDGTPSIRAIAPERVWRSRAGHLCVRGLCALRGEHRTFRVARITALETA